MNTTSHKRLASLDLLRGFDLFCLLMLQPIWMTWLKIADNPGYDKVVFQTELYQLPAPEIEIYNDHTKVTLYAHKAFAQMGKEDRYRACYLHACLKRVNRDVMTNASLRERFHIDKQNSSMVSRLLNETCALGWIYISPDSTSLKNRKYLPFWA